MSDSNDERDDGGSKGLEITQRLEGDDLAAIQKRAARIAAQMAGAQADETRRMSLVEEMAAAQAPAVPFDPSRPAAPPSPSAASLDERTDLGNTVVATGQAGPPTPFETTVPETSPWAPESSLAAPRPPARPWTRRPVGPQPPPVEPAPIGLPTAVEEVPAPTSAPVTHSALPPDAAPSGPVEPKLLGERPEIFYTPRRRLEARNLAALMSTNDEDLERYRQRHVGRDSGLEAADLERLRDLLGAMAESLARSDDATRRRIRAAWEVLWNEPRRPSR